MDGSAGVGDERLEENTPTADETSKSDTNRSLFDEFEQLTVFRVVGVITILALVLRLVALEARPAHWDEARVAYWANLYAESGSLGYHYEEHGPLVQIVAGRLFEFMGASDLAARLPVAIVGGLFPLAALLFRERLRKSETVALAVLLTINPVLLYYSRFMRSDVLVATFMFVAFGLVVRFLDTRKVRYLYVAGLCTALGFASKENAVLYLITWGGATALLADQSLHSPASETSGFDRLRSRFSTYYQLGKGALRRSYHLLGIAFVMLVPTVFLFAPRGYGVERRWTANPSDKPLNLGTAIGDPTKLYELSKGTLESTYDGYKEWFSQSSEKTFDEFTEFLIEGYLDLFVDTMPIFVLAVLAGIAVERYTRTDSRPLVMFMAYCGAASLVGYPIGSHIYGDWGWISTHIVVPLTIPAAVGLAWAYRTIRQEMEIEFGDLDSKVVVMLLLVFGLVWFAAIPYQTVYANPQADSNDLVQYAQPHDDLSPLVDRMDRIAAQHNGDDVVLYYGKDADYDEAEALVVENLTGDPGGWDIHPRCSRWAKTQPLNWYFAMTDTNATCVRERQTLLDRVYQNPPPMIIALEDDSSLPSMAVSGAYEKETYYIRTIGSEIAVYTHNSWTASTES